MLHIGLLLLYTYIKDTTDFINKLELGTSKGPLPEGTLLVSWDVAAMFPNIDNSLGLKAIEEALNSRNKQSPCTESLVEAVKICLEHNNSAFNGVNFVQSHGTAMGPKNGCSYADIAMSYIDKIAVTQGPYRPNNCWRFRDDIFDLWHHGFEALHEFTDFINNIYPTIKFVLRYSTDQLEFLDVMISLNQGHITTDVFSKPTDSHLYLLKSSAHPKSSTKSIPYSID